MPERARNIIAGLLKLGGRAQVLQRVQRDGGGLGDIGQEMQPRTRQGAELLIVDDSTFDLGVEDLKFSEILDIEISFSEVALLLHLIELFADEIGAFLEHLLEGKRQA